MTQEKFAKKLGLKRQTIATYETGRSEPMDNIVISICREFNVNREWLLTGEGNMYNMPEDETAAVVSELLEESNPVYDAVISIVQTYQKLDEKSQKVMDNFIKEVYENFKKEG